MWSYIKEAARSAELSMYGLAGLLLVSLLTSVTLTFFSSSNIAQAADNGTWNGNSITFDNEQYTYAGTASNGQPPSVPDGDKYYVHADATNNSDSQSSSIIYMDKSQNSSSNATAHIMNATYTLSTKKYSNASKAQDITVETDPSSSSATNGGTTSCSSDFVVGWIICPLSNTIAKAMDYLYGIVSSFMTVKPITLNNSNDTMYTAWNAMRTIANAAFIIVFIILIYSQLTSIGISNYGIKKLLPKIIIGAILVNVSYYICALGVDLSNILGISLQDFFMTLRKNLFHMNTDQLVSFSSITGFILSGGTASLAAGATVVSAIATTGGSITGVLWMLLPAFIGLLVAVVVVLLILAARQALIIILLILSPVAFVAYLLPNTDGLFKKWKDLFITMLVFFPAMSVVFGGAQLAGSLIVQNASNLNTVVLGLIVQVAPLAMAPFVLKFSGSLLGNIAGIVNDPSKGLVDRTRNMSQQHVNARKMQALDPTKRPIRRFTPRAVSRRLNYRSMRLNDATKAHQQNYENAYHKSNGYSAIAMGAYKAELDKKQVEQDLEKNIKVQVQGNPQLLNKEMKVRVTTKQAELENAKLDATFEQLAAGNTSAMLSAKARQYQLNPKSLSGDEAASARRELAVANALTPAASDTARDLALASMSKRASQRVQHDNLSNALLSDRTIRGGQKARQFAAGADTTHGADTSLAYAINLQSENTEKVIAERNSLISHFKLNGADRQTLARGGVVKAIDGDSHRYTFDSNSDISLRAAASATQMYAGSLKDIEEIITSTGKGHPNYELRGMIADSVVKAHVADKNSALGGATIDAIQQGDIADQADLNKATFNFIRDGKFSAHKLASNDAAAIQRMMEVTRGANHYAKDATELSKFYASARELRRVAGNILNNDSVRAEASNATKLKLYDMTKSDLNIPQE